MLDILAKVLAKGKGVSVRKGLKEAGAGARVRSTGRKEHGSSLRLTYDRESKQSNGVLAPTGGGRGS